MFVEEDFGVEGAEPVFEGFELGGIFFDVGEGDLVGAPGAFEFVIVELGGGGPAFGGAEDDHGPAWAGEWPAP